MTIAAQTATTPHTNGTGPALSDPYDQLAWLAEQGARFALPRDRSKKEFETGWQNKPHSLKEAIHHATRGGNVGILTGDYSDGIITIDRDIKFAETVAMLGEMGQTAKIVRDNAPDRGKFLYRIVGALPPTTSWREHPGDKHPACECLAKGRHALGPTSEFDGGHYVLIDTHYGIKELTTAQIERVWWMITGESFDKSQRRASPNDAGELGDYKAKIRDAWSTQAVFEYFDRHHNGATEERGETRLLGNGGLLISDWRWYCHSDDEGGDQFDAWSYCKHGHTIDRSNGKAFWGIADEMAAVKGIPKPKIHVNGNSSKAATAEGPEDGEAPTDEPGEERKPKQSVQVYEMATVLAEFFTAQDGEAYVLVPVRGRRECHKLRSKAFRNFLASAFYERKDTIPSVTAIQEALSLLEWDAQKNRQEVFVRVAGHEGKIYIDLGDADWRAVEVDADGWRIVQIPPVAFRRSKALAELPEPEPNGDLDKLREIVNIDTEDWPLVGAWLLAAMQPAGPYPVLCFVGEQGTAKSTTVRALKSLIDPSMAGLRGQPEDIRDLMIAASNNWLLAYDNISYLSNDVSDALCRISTGGGYAKRSLYTDDEEFIIDATRPVVMNGITEIISRPDLLDRSLLIELPVLPPEKRKPEKEYWAEFEKLRPAVFGALLDALSFALGSLPYVALERLPRMADFAKLGTASWGMFYAGEDDKKQFVDLYEGNREQGTGGIIEASPLAGPLKSLVAIDGEWEGESTELLEKLSLHATDRQKDSKGWPSTPDRLSSALKRIAPALRVAGVVDAQQKKVRGRRKWTIKRLIERSEGDAQGDAQTP